MLSKLLFENYALYQQTSQDFLSSLSPLSFSLCNIQIALKKLLHLVRAFSFFFISSICMRIQSSRSIQKCLLHLAHNLIMLVFIMGRFSYVFNNKIGFLCFPGQSTRLFYGFPLLLKNSTLIASKR